MFHDNMDEGVWPGMQDRREQLLACMPGCKIGVGTMDYGLHRAQANRNKAGWLEMEIAATSEMECISSSYFVTSKPIRDQLWSRVAVVAGDVLRQGNTTPSIVMMRDSQYRSFTDRIRDAIFASWRIPARKPVP